MTTFRTTASAVLDPPAGGRAERLIRRVAFFKRIGLFGGSETGFEIRRALSLEDHWQAYCLVHDCYVDRGYIEPRAGGVRVRPFEALPEMATFVAKAEGRVVAVTSVLMDSPDLGLPSDEAFREELGALRAEGRRVCEITNLAVAPEHRNTPVFSELTRCCLAHAMAIGYDDLFIAISPEHARFFQEVLQFDAWGGRRSYSSQVEDIVEGKRLDLRRVEARSQRVDAILAHEAFLHGFYFQENPYHRLVRKWAIRAVGVFRDVHLLRELFAVRSHLLDGCSFAELNAIRSRWGREIFAQVAGPLVGATQSQPVGGYGLAAA